MELDDRALPLTRGQLDIWLAQETGHPGTKWQVTYFVRIEGTSGSRHPVQEAQEIASSIQRMPMPLTGPLFKFALFRTRPDEFYCSRAATT
jgi:hypothetical protein